MASKNKKKKRNKLKQNLPPTKIDNLSNSPQNSTPSKIPKTGQNKTKCILTDFLNEPNPGQNKAVSEPLEDLKNNLDSFAVSQPLATTNKSSNSTITCKPLAIIKNSSNLSSEYTVTKDSSKLSTTSEPLADSKDNLNLSTISEPLAALKKNFDLSAISDTLDSSDANKPKESKIDFITDLENCLTISNILTDVSSEPSIPENKVIHRSISDSSLCLPVESSISPHAISLQEEVALLKSENSQLKKEIQALKSSASKLKSGLYCSICLNYYHVPHGIDCGHVFCFSCIRFWLKSLVDKNLKLECPLCRHNITKVPNLVLTLHHHLLDLLQEDSLQHALVLQSIREHFVCFQGENNKWGAIFPKCGVRASFYDAEDDVARCTTCNWEVVGKFCANCNAAYSGASEEEHSDSSTSVSEDNSDGSLDESLSNFIPESEYDLPDGSKFKDSDNESNDSFICKDNEVDYDSEHEIENSSSSDSDVSIKEINTGDSQMSEDSEVITRKRPNSRDNHISDDSDVPLSKKLISKNGHISEDSEPIEDKSEDSADGEKSPILSKNRTKKLKRLIVSDSD